MTEFTPDRLAELKAVAVQGYSAGMEANTGGKSVSHGRGISA